MNYHSSNNNSKTLQFESLNNTINGLPELIKFIAIYCSHYLIIVSEELLIVE